MPLEKAHLTIRFVDWSAGWGRLLRAKTTRGFVAWLAVLIISVAMLSLYYVLNENTGWAAFLTFLVLDCGVSFLGLTLVLLCPLEIVLGFEPTRTHTSEHDGLLREPRDSPQTSEQIMISTHKDKALTIHTFVSLTMFVSSILSDNIATYLSEESHMSLVQFLAFMLMDFTEDFFYIVGFLCLAVSYRTLSIQLWHLQQDLEEHDVECDALLPKLQFSLLTYESIFDRAEALSARTSSIALAMIAFVALEMAFTVTTVFEESHFVFDIQHVALLRLLLALSSLLLQVALSAADVMYASERLAEALARHEIALSMDKAAKCMYGSTSEGDQSATLATVCRAFGTRVRSHPVRIRLSWFHLTTEWALGISLLVATVLLAIVGIKLPGGE